MSRVRKRLNKEDRVTVSLKDSLIGGEGLKEVDEKRQKFVEKHAIKVEISEKEEQEIFAQINAGVSMQTNKIDISKFVFLQFLPLLLISSASFVPGIVLLSKGSFLWIFIILGSLGYFYALIRLISSLTFKVEISKEKIRWRNIFKWNEIPNEDITEINPIQGFLLYFTKLGGVGKVCVEIIQISTEEKDYWLRAYPFEKEKGKRLVLFTQCWSNLGICNH